MNRFTHSTTLLENYRLGYHPMNPQPQLYTPLQCHPMQYIDERNANSIRTPVPNTHAPIPMKKPAKNVMSSSMRDQFKNTKLCPHLEKGCCHNGSQCTFAHNESQIRPLPDLKHTKLCENTKQGKECTNPDCQYAHDHNQLKPSTDLTTYKTQPCFFWVKGKCLNKDKCRFAHGLNELKLYKKGSTPKQGCVGSSFDQNLDRNLSDTTLQSSEGSYMSSSTPINYNEGANKYNCPIPPPPAFPPHSQSSPPKIYNQQSTPLYNDNRGSMSVDEILAAINKEDLMRYIKEQHPKQTIQLESDKFIYTEQGLQSPYYNKFSSSSIPTDDILSDSIPLYNFPDKIQNGNVKRNTTIPYKIENINKLNGPTQNQTPNSFPFNQPNLVAAYLENELRQINQRNELVNRNHQLYNIEEKPVQLISPPTNPTSIFQTQTLDCNGINNFSAASHRDQLNQLQGASHQTEHTPVSSSAENFLSFISQNFKDIRMDNINNQFNKTTASNNTKSIEAQLDARKLYPFGIKDLNVHEGDEEYGHYIETKTSYSFPHSTGLPSNQTDFTDCTAQYFEDSGISSNEINACLAPSLPSHEACQGLLYRGELDRYLLKINDQASKLLEPTNYTPPSTENAEHDLKNILGDGARLVSSHANSPGNRLLLSPRVNFPKFSSSSDLYTSQANMDKVSLTSSLLNKHWTNSKEPDSQFNDATLDLCNAHNTFNKHLNNQGCYNTQAPVNAFSYNVDLDSILSSKHTTLPSTTPNFPYDNLDWNL